MHRGPRKGLREMSALDGGFWKASTARPFDANVSRRGLQRGATADALKDVDGHFPGSGRSPESLPCSPESAV